MKKKTSMTRLFMPYVGLFVVVMIVFFLYNMKSAVVHELNYNEFMNNLSKEQVSKLEITPRSRDSVYYIEGKLEGYKNNETFELNYKL